MEVAIENSLTDLKVTQYLQSATFLEFFFFFFSGLNKKFAKNPKMCQKMKPKP